MIELNLIPKKKKTKLPPILGVDLNHVKWFPLLFAYLLTYIPDFFIIPEWQSRTEQLLSKNDTKRSEIDSLKLKIEGKDDVQNEIDAYNIQLEKLKARELLVEQIIQTKSNPMRLMLHLAKNIPDDMWINYFLITPEKEITISGVALTYKSIGNYLYSANESIFFNKSLQLEKSEPQVSTDVGMRGRTVNNFSIKGKIVRFD